MVAGFSFPFLPVCVLFVGGLQVLCLGPEYGAEPSVVEKDSLSEEVFFKACDEERPKTK